MIAMSFNYSISAFSMYVLVIQFCITKIIPFKTWTELLRKTDGTVMLILEINLWLVYCLFA